MPCAPLPVLQEGGCAVIGCFPGSIVWGSGGPAPVEVTGGPGGEGGMPILMQEGLASECWAQN